MLSVLDLLSSQFNSISPLSQGDYPMSRKLNPLIRLGGIVFLMSNADNSEGTIQ
jgi:hypothetical protein